MAWLRSWDTGISSETIWRVLMHETPRYVDIPHDPADFGRCYRLLKAVPSWRERLTEVAAAVPKWRPFVAAWDELTALYEQELPSGVCPLLYRRMRELCGEPMSAAEFEWMTRPREQKPPRRRRRARPTATRDARPAANGDRSGQ